MEKKREQGIKEKFLKSTLIVLVLSCVCLTSVMLIEEVNAESVSF